MAVKAKNLQVEAVAWDNQTIYCEATCDPQDVYYDGSEDEDYDDPKNRRLRYEIAGRRFLDGQEPFLLSTSLRGPFDKESGWINPWRSQNRTVHTSDCKLKGTSHMSKRRKKGRGHVEPKQSLDCLLPSPESLKQAQVTGAHPFLKKEELEKVQQWRSDVNVEPRTEGDLFPAMPKDTSGLKKRRSRNSEWPKQTKKKKRNGDGLEVEIMKVSPLRSKRFSKNGADAACRPSLNSSFYTTSETWSSRSREKQLRRDQETDAVDELMVLPGASFNSAPGRLPSSKRVSPMRNVWGNSLGRALESEDELSQQNLAAATLSSPVSDDGLKSKLYNLHRSAGRSRRPGSRLGVIKAFKNEGAQDSASLITFPIGFRSGKPRNSEDHSCVAESPDRFMTQSERSFQFKIRTREGNGSGCEGSVSATSIAFDLGTSTPTTGEHEPIIVSSTNDAINKGSGETSVGDDDSVVFLSSNRHSASVSKTPRSTSASCDEVGHQLDGILEAQRSHPSGMYTNVAIPEVESDAKLPMKKLLAEAGTCNTSGKAGFAGHKDSINDAESDLFVHANDATSSPSGLSERMNMCNASSSSVCFSQKLSGCDKRVGIPVSQLSPWGFSPSSRPSYLRCGHLKTYTKPPSPTVHASQWPDNREIQEDSMPTLNDYAAQSSYGAQKPNLLERSRLNTPVAGLRTKEQCSPKETQAMKPQNTPMPTPMLQRMSEPVFPIKPFASFMSPSPELRKRHCKHAPNGNGMADSPGDSKGGLLSVYGDTGSTKSTAKRVSWAPLPGEADNKLNDAASAAGEAGVYGTCRGESENRPSSPAPETPIAELPITEDEKFHRHFFKVASRKTVEGFCLTRTGPEQMLVSHDQSIAIAEECPTDGCERTNLGPGEGELEPREAGQYGSDESEDPVSMADDLFRDMLQTWDIEAELNEGRKTKSGRTEQSGTLIRPV